MPNSPDSTGNAAQIGWDFTHAGIGSAFPAVKITNTALDGYGAVYGSSVCVTGVGISVLYTSAAITSGKMINASLISSSAALANFSGAVATFSYSMTGTHTSGTVAHTNNGVSITGTIVSNGTGGTTTATGNLLAITSVHTSTLGTFTSDARVCLNITNALGVTGAPISVTQSNITSTHFYKVMKETTTGVTLWMGDGNTGNSALTGTAGDILFNGGSNKPEYCTGTTSWTALV